MDNNEQQAEKTTALIDLDTYQISFMPDYTGFLYIEAKKAEIDVQNKGKLSFKEKLIKFYVEKNSYVIIHNPINLKSVRFEKFTKKEQEETIQDNSLRSETFEELKKKYGNKNL